MIQLLLLSLQVAPEAAPPNSWMADTSTVVELTLDEKRSISACRLVKRTNIARYDDEACERVLAHPDVAPAVKNVPKARSTFQFELVSQVRVRLPEPDADALEAEHALRPLTDGWGYTPGLTCIGPLSLRPVSAFLGNNPAISLRPVTRADVQAQGQALASYGRSYNLLAFGDRRFAFPDLCRRGENLAATAIIGDLPKGSSLDDGSVFGAIRLGDRASLAARLRAGTQSLDRVDPMLRLTAVQLAAAKGRLDMIRILTDGGARLFPPPGQSAPWPIFELAVRFGHRELANWLLARVPVDPMMPGSMRAVLSADQNIGTAFAQSTLHSILGRQPAFITHAAYAPSGSDWKNASVETRRAILTNGAWRSECSDSAKLHGCMQMAQSLFDSPEFLDLFLSKGASLDRQEIGKLIAIAAGTLRAPALKVLVKYPFDMTNIAKFAPTRGVTLPVPELAARPSLDEQAEEERLAKEKRAKEHVRAQRDLAETLDALKAAGIAVTYAELL
ncbi:ankyrin repeat domain-containing protein [Sphingomonas cavernae]|uniref:Ankyrin repeat domain-containing protein n=1 Tax=Sphingomonas cavernae TaxID=2320861 RepID=A0A418WLE8_9SPHN|nr:ankyrin repeat domain-containing protein [Sphingomonas cavernae]RJF90825.1 hypothetical protein D3876_11580 [Sphingomonas cavernae]